MPEPFHYDAYTFHNTSGASQCVTVRIDAGGCTSRSGLFSEAYLAGFDPKYLAANHLRDAGSAIHRSARYSFMVPANYAFVVVVEESQANSGCSSYSLTVSGTGVTA